MGFTYSSKENNITKILIFKKQMQQKLNVTILLKHIENIGFCKKKTNNFLTELISFGKDAMLSYNSVMSSSCGELCNCAIAAITMK